MNSEENAESKSKNWFFLYTPDDENCVQPKWPYKKCSFLKWQWQSNPDDINLKVICGVCILKYSVSKSSFSSTWPKGNYVLNRIQTAREARNFILPSRGLIDGPFTLTSSKEEQIEGVTVQGCDDFEDLKIIEQYIKYYKWPFSKVYLQFQELVSKHHAYVQSLYDEISKEPSMRVLPASLIFQYSDSVPIDDYIKVISKTLGYSVLMCDNYEEMLQMHNGHELVCFKNIEQDDSTCNAFVNLLTSKDAIIGHDGSQITSSLQCVVFLTKFPDSENSVISGPFRDKVFPIIPHELYIHKDVNILTITYNCLHDVSRDCTSSFKIIQHGNNNVINKMITKYFKKMLMRSEVISIRRFEMLEDDLKSFLTNNKEI